jgi:hypothetical protein
LRLFKKNFFKIVRIFVKTSRCLMSDDITSIRAKNLYVFRTINILRDQVISTSRVWLLNDRRRNIYIIENDYKNEVLNLNNFRWRLFLLSLVDVNNSVINSVERLFDDVCV